jgi:hypothetical protein
MRERSIGGVLDLRLLSAPAGVCQPCHATWRATRPRPLLCYCPHNRVVARQRADGSWKTLQDVSPANVALMREWQEARDV